MNTRSTPEMANFTDVLGCKSAEPPDDRRVSVPGLLGLLVFYMLILAVGILAAWWKTRRAEAGQKCQGAIVAGREIGLVVGIFTMTGRRHCV